MTDAAITRQADFDLAILEIRMPGVDGLTTLATLRRLLPRLRIAILSAFVDLLGMKRATANGAVGYLPKSMDRQPLVNALRSLLAGGRFFPAYMLQPSEAPANPQELPAWKSYAVGRVELTSRQKAVLSELARGISNREIGTALSISEITVKIHVHSCQKLAVRNRTQAVQRGRSLGLLPD